MKKRTIRYLERARKDIAAILLWIAERSPQGAARLVLAMETALEKAKRFPFAYSIAPESHRAGVEIRQIFFKTPR
jgi:plasmid stabilization system protein ParE